MELVSEMGCVVLIPRGCKRELGRGSELAISDKTVSRHQVLVELKEQREKLSSEDDDDSSCGLSIEVLGANPICILHAGQLTGGKNDSQEMVFLKKGDKGTMFTGDKISLSLSHPRFFTAVKEDGKKDLRPEIVGRLDEDDLLEKWKDRKSRKEAGTSISHATVHSDALMNRCSSEDRGIAENEKAGIAEAVARRQRRAVERRQQQALKLQERDEEAHKLRGEQGEEVHELRDEWVKELENRSNLQQEALGLEDGLVKAQHIDPIKEFGFLVEGSEFDQYKHHRQHRGRWICPPSMSPAGSCSEDEVEDWSTPKHSRKARVENDDEEWTGDDEEEVVAVASAKKRKSGAKLNLRSHDRSTPTEKHVSLTKRKTPHGKRVKNQREEPEEDEDETDETLGGFIVNDEEEDLIENNDADDEEELLDDNDDGDEEEEFNEDEEMDRAEEDEDLLEEGTKERQEKPLCKYGKNCYRKNLNHLAQFRHQ